MRALPAMAFVLLLAACGQEGPATAGSAPEAASEPDVTASAEPELDPMSGLKMTGDWQIVRANCVACHSGKLITQQRGTAEQWLAMIRWMQAKQNLWQFDPVTEEKIIAYLAENYPPGRSQRRAALPPALMPPNPYKQ
jgi:predicted small lipoprotein YifL